MVIHTEGSSNKAPVFVECYFIISSFALSEMTAERYINCHLSQILKYPGKNTNGKSIQLAGLKKYSEFNKSSAINSTCPSPQEVISATPNYL